MTNTKQLTYEVFAYKVYCETQDQHEVVSALQNEYNELAEDEAEQIAIEAVEEYKANQEYKGEQQFEHERELGINQ